MTDTSLSASQLDARQAQAAAGAGTLCEAFQASAALGGDAPAISAGDGSRTLSWDAYAREVRAVAAGLAGLGLHRGDTIALMMGNRPEFHICDAAAMHLGVTAFSVYVTSAPAQIAFVLAQAECKLVIAEAAHLELLRAAEIGELPVVVLDAAREDAPGLQQLIDTAPPDFDFEAAWRAVTPQDVLTLIFTSGTTGPPKGVELTHANMLAECRAAAACFPVRRAGRTISYLPTAHVADRWSSHYSPMLHGAHVVDVADVREVIAALPAIAPTMWGVVPRILEKLQGVVAAHVTHGGAEARDALEAGVAVVRRTQAGEPVDDALAQRHRAAAPALAALRSALGLAGCEWIWVGSAPLAREVQEYLLGIGLPIGEVYGQSECSCCATGSAPHEAVIGSVGRALPGIEVSLAGDGEVRLRGATVMRGYRGRPDLTAEAVDGDGWLSTGDIGRIDDDGMLWIVDRKKELIINAAGKNMSPANIESELKNASPLIGQALVIGDRRPYNVALLVLDPEGARAHALAHDGDGTVSVMAGDPDVRAAVAEAVQRANARLSRVEQIKRFALLGDEWLAGGDELTPTMKLKRRPIADKYAEVIDGLYA